MNIKNDKNNGYGEYFSNSSIEDAEKDPVFDDCDCTVCDMEENNKEYNSSQKIDTSSCQCEDKNCYDHCDYNCDDNYYCDKEEDCCEEDYCHHHNHSHCHHENYKNHDLNNKHRPCILYEDRKYCTDCGDCEMCDLDPSKKCDNCGMCLKEYELPIDEKGFYTFEATLDKDSFGLEELYKAYGLSDDEEDDDNE